MRGVTRTELNQQTARVLARVAAGERLVITDRGRPVAQLTPTAASSTDELVDSGLLTPALTRGALPFAPVKIDATSAAILDDVRAERA